MHKIIKLFLFPFFWLFSLILFTPTSNATTNNDPISKALKNNTQINKAANIDPLQQHPETFQFSSKQKQALALKLAKQLRCPQCQNQNLTESNSPLAQDLRLKVYEKVEAGEEYQDIINYMTARFGEVVHYQPPINKGTFMLWGGPLLIFLMLGWVILRKVKTVH